MTTVLISKIVFSTKLKCSIINQSIPVVWFLFINHDNSWFAKNFINLLMLKRKKNTIPFSHSKSVRMPSLHQYVSSQVLYETQKKAQKWRIFGRWKINYNEKKIKTKRDLKFIHSYYKLNILQQFEIILFLSVTWSFHLNFIQEEKIF